MGWNGKSLTVKRSLEPFGLEFSSNSLLTVEKRCGISYAPLTLPVHRVGIFSRSTYETLNFVWQVGRGEGGFMFGRIYHLYWWILIISTDFA